MRRPKALSTVAKLGALLIAVAVVVGGVLFIYSVIRTSSRIGVDLITAPTQTAPSPTTNIAVTATNQEPKTQSDQTTVTAVTQTFTEVSPKRKTESESQLASSINDFVYQLQGVDLIAIGNTKFDLVIIDYSRDGSEDGMFTAEQINTLKNSPGGGKVVMAYMSIGEAEDYRWYWKESWDADKDGKPDPVAPSWLGPANPKWPGNYKVKYWEAAWQSIIYGSPSSYLDKIIESGFDGVYLDIIDAYEYWGPGGESGLDRATAEQEMVDLVKAIANYARVTRGKTNFRIFPQNGEGLSSHSDYVEVVDGIGREDTWYDDNRPQPVSHTSEVIADLDVFRRANKLVLVIDYVTQRDLISDFYSKAIEKGYVPYATTRDLDVLTINSGHEPD